jgi:glutamyl-tRNA reductase
MLNFGLDYQHVHPTTLALVSKKLEVFERSLQELESVQGYVLLPTCARVEFYIDATSFDDVQAALTNSLTQVVTDAGVNLDAQFAVRRDAKAIEHLFRVTAGLESQVVGETEILGQVRSALVNARAHGSLTRSLELAFNRAIHVSRKVRATYTPGQRSLIHSALEQLNISDAQSALLIGTGQYARVCAQTLRATGITTITGYSPSGRMDDVLDVDGYIAQDQLETALATANLVVTCSGHGEPVITAELIEQALSTGTHPTQTLHIIDLAASADVAADVETLAGVQVLRLADIASLDDDLVLADERISAGVREVMPRIADTELDDLIVALRSRVTAIVKPHLQDEDSLTTHKVIQVLLHTPTLRAREAAVLGRLDEVRHAFVTLFGSGAHSETRSFADFSPLDLALTELDLRAFEELLAVS